MQIKGAGFGGSTSSSTSKSSSGSYSYRGGTSRTGSVVISTASMPSKVFQFPTTSTIKNVAPQLRKVASGVKSNVNYNSKSDLRTVSIDTASGNKGVYTYVENQETARACAASIGNFVLSVAGGAGKTIEGVLDTGITVIGTAESAVVSIFNSDYADALRETTRMLVENDAMGNLTDSIADITGIKNYSNDYEDIKGVGFALGDAATKTAAMVLSGGTAAPIIGLSDAGRKVETEWVNGASYEDGIIAGGVAGLYSTAEWTAGGKITEFAQFGGVGDKVLRVELDGLVGMLSGTEATVTSTIQRYYNGDDVTEKSPIDVFKEEAKKNNMADSVINGLATSIIFSSAGELAGVSKAYREKKSAKVVNEAKNDILDLVSSQGGENSQRQLTQAIEDSLFDAHSSRNLQQVKTIRKAAGELLKEQQNLTDEAVARSLASIENDTLQRIGYDSYVDQATGIRVNLLKGLDTSKSKYNPETVINYVEGLPDELRSSVKEINISDTLDPWENYWIYKYNNSSHSSAASAGVSSGAVNIWSSYNGKSSIVLHEVGHLYDYNPDNLSLWQETVGDVGIQYKISDSQGWKDAMAADYSISGLRGVTAYATSNNSEDFAETVTAYYTNPRKLDNFPNRKELVEKIRDFYEESN